MNASSTPHSRAELSKALSENLDSSVMLTAELRESLEQERSALESQDLEALELIVANKNRYVEKLKTLENQRASLCSRSGFGSAPEQIHELITSYGPGDQITASWDRLLVLATECNNLNMGNGAIIRVRGQQVEAGLSVLRGQAPKMDTYGHINGNDNRYEQRSLAEV